MPRRLDKFLTAPRGRVMEPRRFVIRPRRLDKFVTAPRAESVSQEGSSSRQR